MPGAIADVIIGWSGAFEITSLTLLEFFIRHGITAAQCQATI
jgi:hypothetical protein